MGTRVRMLVVVAVAVVVALLAVGAGYACYRMGYSRGLEVDRQGKDAAREAAAGKTLTDELDLCIHALQSIARNPKAFTPEERVFWRTQTTFLIRMIEDGLLPKLTDGKTLESGGEKLAESRVRKQLEKARELLEKAPV